MRQIQHIHGDKPSHWVGDGFYVKPFINYANGTPDFNYAHSDPFLMLDYSEPMDFAPNPNYESEPHGVGQHPHKGFETVTIAYDGEISHADSTGGRGDILKGDVQWMTAGRGIIHEEFHSPNFGQNGGVFSMVQLWVNLPKKHKLTDAKYQTLKRDDMAVVQLTSSSDKSVGRAAIIAGDLQGEAGIASTFTPINLWDIELDSEGSTTLHVPSTHNVMILVQQGELLINGMLVDAGKLVQFAEANEQGRSATDAITLTYQVSDNNKNNDSNLVPAKLLLMSGEPIGEPVAGYGPFVMNTQAEIKQTFHDYQTGNFI
ncbi:pirin family protein [Psychrobacter sp. DM4]|uniref:pirin family protein n=1 Tax=Psychrobacter sp. DM4 TaxID=3440637 RepID=UPI003F4F87BB